MNNVLASTVNSENVNIIMLCYDEFNFLNGDTDNKSS